MKRQYLKPQEAGTTIFAMSPDMKNDLLHAGCPEEKIRVHYYGTDTKWNIKGDYIAREKLVEKLNSLGENQSLPLTQHVTY